MKFLRMNLVLLCVFTSGYVNAAESVVAKVLKVGCHIVECKFNNQLRYNSEEISNADALYSSLLLAQTTGQSIQFGTVDSTCLGNYSTFGWFFVQPQ